MRLLKLVVLATFLALVGLVGLHMPASVAHAATSFSWTGQGDGTNWGDSKNWNPNGIPSTGDDVTIGSSAMDYDVFGLPQGMTLQNLTLQGSSTELNGGSLTVTGSFTWSGTSSLSTSSFTVDGTADISDNGQKILSGPCGSGIDTVTLAGTTTLSSSGLVLNCSNLVVPNTGTFTAQPGSMITAPGCCVSPAQFINQGSVVVPSTLAGTASAIISAVAFTDSGRVSIGSNSTLDLEIAPSTFASGVSFSGAGTLLIQSSAIVQLSGSVNLGSGTTFQLAQGGQFGTPGTLTGTGTLSGSGSTFSWTGGTITANLTVASSVSISSNDRKLLQDPGTCGTGLLTLQGNTTLSGTGLFLGGCGEVLTNTGTFSPQAGATIGAFGCCLDPGKFLNKGRLNVNVGAGNMFGTSLVAFFNSGTVELKSGTFKFADLNYTQTAGTTRLDGGALTSANSAIVDLQGGSLGGNGTITASVQNGVLIDPGGTAPSVGRLTIIGNYTQTASGTLRADIKSSTSYDQLVVNGTATLGGTLDIETASGFIPIVTNQFIVVKATTRTGTFKTLLHTKITTHLQYYAQYTSTSAILKVKKV